ncbi:hypothetical protein [Candidatus Sororendozoicomonas aggregata]|uniref:hypothetical protein n=1 Tax=Candidatus Sororendozoicomonas aggregata TaxID=3073239 RepID=UPI002ED397A6
MKKYILYFSLPALILWATSNVYASTCQEDFNAMSNVIKSKHTLSTKNGIEISQLFGPVDTMGAEACGAAGNSSSSFHRYSYKLSWVMGNWRDTLMAAGPLGH